MTNIKVDPGPVPAEAMITMFARGHIEHVTPARPLFSQEFKVAICYVAIGIAIGFALGLFYATKYM